jgi:hypothetical protein
MKKNMKKWEPDILSFWMGVVTALLAVIIGILLK